MKRRRRVCRSRIPCARPVRGSAGSHLCPEDANRKQLRAGINVEREHGVSKKRACRIALDHLAEDRRYYTKLRRAGL